MLDCQSDLLEDLATRTVVPLMPETMLPPPLPRLNPVFTVDGQALVMATQLIFAIPVARLDHLVTNIDTHHYTIMNALDMLLTGY